jgi:hypothetical protein
MTDFNSRAVRFLMLAIDEAAGEALTRSGATRTRRF